MLSNIQSDLIAMKPTRCFIGNRMIFIVMIHVDKVCLHVLKNRKLYLVPKKHYNGSLRQNIHCCYEWFFLNECITRRSLGIHSHFLVHYKWIILQIHICFSCLVGFKYNGKLHDDLLRSKYVVWNAIHPLCVDIYYRYLCLHHKHIRRLKAARKH